MAVYKPGREGLRPRRKGLVQVVQRRQSAGLALKAIESCDRTEAESAVPQQ